MNKLKKLIFKQSTLLLTLFMIVITASSCTHIPSEYEAIIAKIIELDPPKETLTKYKMTDFSDLSTLKKMPDDYFSERGRGKGNIWVHPTGGNLVVFIETKDNGHAGEFGLAYSKTGETPIWYDDEWGELWSLDKQISDHWWKVSYRLG